MNRNKLVILIWEFVMIVLLSIGAGFIGGNFKSGIICFITVMAFILLTFLLSIRIVNKKLIVDW